MDKFGELLVTVLCSVLASSGVWTILAKMMDKKDNRNRLLLGLANDRIIALGKIYLTRGDWITYDEYENFVKYLYQPYIDSGGDGLAEKTFKQISNLRLVPNDYRPKGD